MENTLGTLSTWRLEGALHLSLLEAWTILDTKVECDGLTLNVAHEGVFIAWKSSWSLLDLLLKISVET